MINAATIRRAAGSMVLAVAILMPAAAHALASDRNKPLNVSADKIEVNQKTGRSKYVGNVVLTQGSLRIEATEVTVELREGELDKVTARGKPVTFRQRLDGQTEEIKGSALRVQYLARENRIELFDQVAFRQGDDVFRSPVVRYDIGSERLTADADEQGRVHSIIHPKKSTDESTQNPSERAR